MSSKYKEVSVVLYLIRDLAFSCIHDSVHFKVFKFRDLSKAKTGPQGFLFVYYDFLKAESCVFDC